MVNVDIRAAVVPSRGSGMPDYSRQAVGSQQLAIGQTSGSLAVTSVSGDTVYTQAVTDFFSPVDGVTNLRQNQASGGRIRSEVFPFGWNGVAWDRIRTVSGAHVSGAGAAQGVLAVSEGLPVVSGDLVSRVEHGYVLSGGDVLVSTPASGKSLQVRDLHDSYMGTSGIVPVAYRFGQGAGTFYDHQIGASIPNWDKNLLAVVMQGPKRTASGIADLMINVGIPSTSGVSYTVVVEEV